MPFALLLLHLVVGAGGLARSGRRPPPPSQKKPSWKPRLLDAEPAPAPPRVLHRDFKPANILLDASLRAYLGDTGFAKAAHRTGEESSLACGASTNRVMFSAGYAHKDVMTGQYSETTEAYAVGMTLLVVLTRHEPVDIEETIEEEHNV